MEKGNYLVEIMISCTTRIWTSSLPSQSKTFLKFPVTENYLILQILNHFFLTLLLPGKGKKKKQPTALFILADEEKLVLKPVWMASWL